MARRSFTFSWILFFSVLFASVSPFSPSANAEDNSPARAANLPTADDASAVRGTVTNYIEGYFTGDAPRLEQTLDPHYLKHVIHEPRVMREMTESDLMNGLRGQGVPDMPAADKTEQVTVLDVAGDIASAKLVTPEWTDYMTLLKVNGKWKILSVVQRIN
jgi:hypothetical protein